MTKGSYRVGEDTRQGQDTSFRSFICALLVFLAICLIIFLSTFTWKNVGTANDTNENKSDDIEVVEKLEGDFKVRDEKERIILEKFPVIKTTTVKSTTLSEVSSAAETPFTPEKYDSSEDIIVTTETHEHITSTSNSQNNSNVKSIKPELMTSTTTSSFAEPSATTGIDVNDVRTEINNSDEKETTTIGTTFISNNVSLDMSKEEGNKTEESTSTTYSKNEEQVVTTTVSIADTEIKAFDAKRESTTLIFYDEEREKEESTTKISEYTSSDTNATSTTESVLKTESVIPKNRSLLSSTAEPATTTEEEISIYEQEVTMVPEKQRTTINLKSNKHDTSIFYTNSETCKSSVCNTAASRLLSFMNHSAGPCEDFYEFACGGEYGVWNHDSNSEVEVIVSTQLLNRGGSLPKHLQVFQNFYFSCVEHENEFVYSQRIDEVTQLLREVGQFHRENETLPSDDLTDLFSELILRQSMPLFDIGMDIDKQSSNFILQLTLPQRSSLRMGLKSWSALSLLKERCLKQQKKDIQGSFINLNQTYKLFVECQKDYTSYLKSIDNVVRELEVFGNLSSIDLFKEIQDIKFTIEFSLLNSLDLLPTHAEISRVYLSRKYDVRKVSDLQAQYPLIQWKRLLQTLTGHAVEDNALVQVYFGDYFTKMFNALGKASRRKLKNAFLAIYVNDVYQNTVISHEQDDREEFCLQLSKKLMPNIWSHLVKLAYQPEEQNYHDELTDSLFLILREGFCKSLNEAQWIDSDLKVSIMKKCKNLNVELFAAPEKDQLISDYLDVVIFAGNYSVNLIHLLRNLRRIIYAHEGDQFSSQTIFSYFIDPLDTQPLTFYPVGTIVVPIGLLKKVPPGLPGYLVMTRVGLHLAREIARHFDPTGMKYGVKLKNYSSATFTELIRSTQSMKDVSSPRLFMHRNVSFMASTPLFTNEKILENAAFRLILDSFNLYGNQQLLQWVSNTYGREKVFFIAAAQEYCKKISILDFMVEVFESSVPPSTIQVENIMGNSQTFLDRFSCPEGSGMDRYYEKLQFPYMTTTEDEEEYNQIQD